MNLLVAQHQDRKYVLHKYYTFAVSYGDEVGRSAKQVAIELVLRGRAHRAGNA